MKKFKKLKLKDFVKRTRKIKPEEWNAFNERMTEVMKESRRKQAASLNSAKDIWLD